LRVTGAQAEGRGLRGWSKFNPKHFRFYSPIAPSPHVFAQDFSLSLVVVVFVVVVVVFVVVVVVVVFLSLHIHILFFFLMLAATTMFSLLHFFACVLGRSYVLT